MSWSIPAGRSKSKLDPSRYALQSPPTIGLLQVPALMICQRGSRIVPVKVSENRTVSCVGGGVGTTVGSAVLVLLAVGASVALLVLGDNVGDCEMGFAVGAEVGTLVLVVRSVGENVAVVVVVAPRVTSNSKTDVVKAGSLPEFPA